MAFVGHPDVKEKNKTGLTLGGKEILLTKERGHPKTGLMDKRAIQTQEYDHKKRFEATSLYAATGSFVLAAEKSGVDEKIIRKWSKEPWFRDILHDFRIENLGKLDAAFTDIIDKAAIELRDRLENGDWHVTSKGQLIRRPVGIRDLALVQAINIDKRQLIRGEPTSRPESNQGATVKVLETLAEKFTEIVNKKRAPILIEGEVVEVLENHYAGSSGEATDSTSPKETA